MAPGVVVEHYHHELIDLPVRAGGLLQEMQQPAGRQRLLRMAGDWGVMCMGGKGRWAGGSRGGLVGAGAGGGEQGRAGGSRGSKGSCLCLDSTTTYTNYTFMHD